MKVLLTVLFLSLIIFSCNNEKSDSSVSSLDSAIIRDGDLIYKGEAVPVWADTITASSHAFTGDIDEYFVISDTLGNVVAEKHNGKWDIPDCKKAMEAVVYIHAKNMEEQRAALQTIYLLKQKINQYEENLRNSNYRYVRN